VSPSAVMKTKAKGNAKVHTTVVGQPLCLEHLRWERIMGALSQGFDPQRTILPNLNYPRWIAIGAHSLLDIPTSGQHSPPESVDVWFRLPIPTVTSQSRHFRKAIKVKFWLWPPPFVCWWKVIDALQPIHNYFTIEHSASVGSNPESSVGAQCSPRFSPKICCTHTPFSPLGKSMTPIPNIEEIKVGVCTPYRLAPKSTLQPPPLDSGGFEVFGLGDSTPTKTF